jgi:CheY-like chemotaxis protein
MPGSTVTPAAVLPPEAFIEEVRATLDHLYDYAFLHNHPLTWRLCGGATDGVTRAKQVRTILLDAIERLRPEPRALGGVAGDEMRTYAILTFRCIDGLSMDEIAAKLDLSRRQAYREYAKAVEAAASLVWNVMPPASVTSGHEVLSQRSPEHAAEPLFAPDPSRMNVAAEEVVRLTSNLLLEQVDLTLVVDEVVALFATRVQQMGVELCLAPVSVGMAVVADRALLRQALLNVLSYALDRAGRGGMVEVGCTAADRAVTLWLGACPGTLESTTKREGVGVTVAQKLVEAMGGQAEIEQTHAAWRCSLIFSAAKRDTVLVVDDNADLTALFQRYAAGHNLNVVGATSGVRALELARELRPQLIILDLMLAHMDGWEILQRLRRSEEARDMPIVICSVLNEPDLAFSMGASDYVTKPISQATLVDVLRRWLGKLPPAVSGSAEQHSAG